MIQPRNLRGTNRIRSWPNRFVIELVGPTLIVSLAILLTAAFVSAAPPTKAPKPGSKSKAPAGKSKSTRRAAPGAKSSANSREKSAQSARRGRSLVVETGCLGCHSVSRAGLKKSTPKVVRGGPDLSGVGKRWRARDLERWLLQDLKKKGKPHSIKFPGSRDQLRDVVQFLSSLR